MKAIKARLSKFSTVDEFVDGWGSYYFSGGLLLPTRNTEPAGTEVSLHIQIATGESVLRGEGTVEEVRTNSAGKPVGMVIRFSKLDANSKELVKRIINHKKKNRTSAAEHVVEASSHSGLTDQATGENLAASELGAIADELEETFDSIFSGSYLNVGDASESGFGESDTPDADAFFAGADSAPVDDGQFDVERADDGESAAEPADTAESEADGPPQPDDEPLADHAAPTEDGAPAEAAAADDSEIASEEDGDNATESEASNQAPATDGADDDSSTPLQGEDDQRPPQTAPEELQPENRVSSFIDEVTGGQSDDDDEQGAVLTHEEAQPQVTSLADAAAKAAAAAAEGEEAFDAMLANATMSTPAAEPRSALNLPVRARKKSLIDRFIDWLKGLFS